MTDQFFERPILNSPYEYPSRHWELDADGQPTNRIIDTRRHSDLITPVPKPKKRKKSRNQTEMVLDAGEGLSTAEQEYNPTPIINEIRTYVEAWRNLRNPDQWQVTPETARFLQHWRHHQFQDIRPFFCQIEAVETAIWLSEVAPKMGPRGPKFWAHLEGANAQANPELLRIALKLATGGGNLFVVFGEPDIEIEKVGGDRVRVKIKGVDVFHPQTGEIESGGPDTIAVWFIDTDYNEESFFVRHAYFLGASRDPYTALKTTLKTEIDQEAWESLYSDTSRPFAKPKSGRIAVKVINHLGDEVMKVSAVR